MAQPALDLLSALDAALAAAVAAVAPAVVHVARGHGGGTGLAWDDAHVVTSSFHTPDRTRVGLAPPGGDGELELREAEVIGRDPTTDVALLRVDGGGLAAPRLRELDGLAVGNLALAVGRPGRAVRASLRAIGVLGPALREDRVALDRYVETDRAIPRGFAGGPLVDAEGAVIGMNTRTLLRGADLAVPTLTLRRVVDELRAHGAVRRGYLGVGAYAARLPAALAASVGRGGAALVASLDEDGPAARAGLLVGDLLVAVDGVPVEGPDALRAALRERGGQRATLAVVRAGAPLDLSVELGRR